MSAAATVSAMVARYGERVRVTDDGRTAYVSAFIQPLRRRHRLYINDTYIPAGYFDNAYRLYISDGTHIFSKDRTATVETAQGAYTVVCAEVFSVSGDVIYVWAILSPICERGEAYGDDDDQRAG